MIEKQLDFFGKIDKPATFTKEMEEVWQNYISNNLFNVGLRQIQLRELIQNDSAVRDFLGAEKADAYVQWSTERQQKQIEADRAEPGDMYGR